MRENLLNLKITGVFEQFDRIEIKRMTHRLEIERDRMSSPRILNVSPVMDLKPRNLGSAFKRQAGIPASFLDRESKRMDVYLGFAHALPPEENENV
jgi:hypothetical protein